MPWWLTWRTVFLDVPALLVKWLFTYWIFFLAVVTALNILNVTLYLMAWWVGHPLLWAH